MNANAETIKLKIEKTINTLAATELRVDQMEAFTRIKACVNMLESVMKELEEHEADNQQE